MMKHVLYGIMLLLFQGTVFTQIIPEPRVMQLNTLTFEYPDTLRVYATEHTIDEAQWFIDQWKLSGREAILKDGATIPHRQKGVMMIQAAQSASDPLEPPTLPGNLNNYWKPTVRDQYRLDVQQSMIMIRAQTDAGVFYAMQTLLQQMSIGQQTISCGVIEDEPSFVHRGMLLDCGRHFMSVEKVKEFIHAMAAYKMNVLHWHLTEDQGWRIQIDAYPKLTEIGAWRQPNQEDREFGFKERMGGFYSKEDIRSIVAYAAQHHITIIPEIELPGHSVAAIASYPWLSCTQQPLDVENEWGVFKDIYCAGNDSVFQFLETVLSEVCELFPGLYIHIGGDEAPKFRWEHCAKCQHRMRQEKLKDEHALQTYFIERVAAFLQTKGKRIIGWDEIMEGGIPADAVIQSWRGMDGGLQAALQGHGVVMSPTSHCYLDYPLSSIDALKVYHFQPIPEKLPSDRHALILGAECNMWSEHTPENRIDDKVFPRLLSMAEVLWKNPTLRNDSLWMNRLLSHYPYMKQLGLNPGFPVVPVKWNATPRNEELVLKCDVQLQGSKLEYFEMPLELPAGSAFEPNVLPFQDSIIIRKPTHVELLCTYQGVRFVEGMFRSCYPHPGMRATLELSNTPSSYYPGTGDRSLLDGQLGSSNFRDGLWQAVQGKDVVAIASWTEPRKISHLLTHWYHYTNAWIFAPSSVEFYGSMDGVQWKIIETVAAMSPQAAKDQFADGSHIIPVEVKLKTTVNVKYVKMVAKSFGPCPTWHDAPGEPSWLFYDEWIME